MIILLIVTLFLAKRIGECLGEILFDPDPYLVKSGISGVSFFKAWRSERINKRLDASKEYEAFIKLIEQKYNSQIFNISIQEWEEVWLPMAIFADRRFSKLVKVSSKAQDAVIQIIQELYDEEQEDAL